MRYNSLVLNRLRDPAVLEDVRLKSLELLRASSVDGTETGWNVEVVVGESNLGVRVSHDTMDEIDITLMEYGLGESAVTHAPLRKLEVFLEEYLQSILLEDLL